jgi:hypothetical protein
MKSTISIGIGSHWTASPARSHRQSSTRLVNVFELMLPPLSVRKGLLLCAALSSLGLALDAQTITPFGGESNIGGPAPGEQSRPVISISETGGLMVWEDNRLEPVKDANGSGIAAVSLSAVASAAGEVFRINTATAGSQEKPSLARLADGRYLVAWETRLGGPAGVFARIVEGDGSLSSPELQISPTTTVENLKTTKIWSGIFRNKRANRKFKFREKITHVREHAGGTSLAALPGGGAVIAYDGVRRVNTNTWTLSRHTSWNGWKSKTNDLLMPILHVGDSMREVFLRFVDAAGQPSGSEIRVNQYTLYNQRTPSVAVLADGNIVVVWVSEHPRTSFARDNFAVRIFARVFAPSGEPLSNEFAVSVDASVANANPCVVPNTGGGFAVLWSQRDPAGETQWDVYSRNFNAGGAAAGEAQLLNQHATGDQFAPRLANIGPVQVAVWTSTGQDGSKEGVYGRILLNGIPSGSEFQINSTTISRQNSPAIAADGQSRFIAVWTSYVGLTGFDLFAQRYTMP